MARIIQGGAPGASLADCWAFMRDHDVPYTPAEYDAKADALAPMPPSRAHIRRLKRDRPTTGIATAPVEPTRPACWMFHQQQLGKLSQINAKPAPAPAPPRVMRFFEPDAVPATPRSSHVDYDAAIARLDRATDAAWEKAVYVTRPPRRY